jgi:hypothetical protein
VTGVVGVTREIGAVDLRGDPADHAAGAPGEEKLDLDMLEQRILLRRVGFLPLHIQVGSVALVAGVEPHRELDEGLEVGLALDRRNDDVRICHGWLRLPFPPCRHCGTQGRHPVHSRCRRP